MIEQTSSPRRRRLLIAAMLAAPALATALELCAVETTRLRDERSPLFAAPFAYSLADAIERNDVDGAFGFIRAGQDPNEPIAVRHPALTGGRSVLVTPLAWAVAMQQRDAVMMLVGYGAQPARVSGLACLAETLGNHEMVRLLERYGAAAEGPECESRTPGQAPLLDLVRE